MIAAGGLQTMGTRAGRKRKSGVQRTPTGRISRSAEARGEITEAEQNDNQRVVKFRRMRELMGRTVTHPLYGFPLGKLALLQIIDQDEYDAGCKWAELTFRHSQVIGLMLPKCKAINWEGAQGRSLAQEPDPEKVEQVRARKDEADRRIREVGLGAMHEMTRVCICDEEPENVPLLVRTLKKLVDTHERR